MFKKFISIGLCLSILFLFGCSKQDGFLYEFDEFYGYLNTNLEYIKLDKGGFYGLGYNLLQKDIINIYEEKSHNKYKESIIIIKKFSDKDLNSFSTENIENIDITGLKLTKGSTNEIKCNEDKYGMVYYQGKYSMNQYVLYMTFGFIKKNNVIYIVSYSTPNEKNRNAFSSSLRNINCK